MKEYTLFLDESGQFLPSKNTLPSMVGGLLMEGKGYSENQAGKILASVKSSRAAFGSIGIAPFHGIQEIQEKKNPHVGEFVTRTMEKLAAAGGRLIHFKSRRNYIVVNSDITYLDVFSEGIVNLAQSLLARTDDRIRLHIFYAHRMNMEKYNRSGATERIHQKDYDLQIWEKIEGCKRASLRPDQLDRLEIMPPQTDNAVKSNRLMLADLICFGLRGGWKSLTPNQKARIRNLNLKVFNIEEPDLWHMVRGYLREGRLGEAMYGWYLNHESAKKTDHWQDFEELLLSRIQESRPDTLAIQYRIFSQLLQSLINRHEHDLILELTNVMKEYFFPMLSGNNIQASEFQFDVYFNDLTAATHKGLDKLAHEDMEMCRELLKALPPKFETLDYFLKYKLREAEDQKNNFDFTGAIRELDKLEGVLDDLVGLTTLVDELGAFGSKMRSTTLGSVLGSRVATRTFILSSETLCSAEQAELLAQARKDSDRSAEHFTGEDDFSRQAQTRCALEYAGGSWQESYRWLAKAFGQPEDIKPKELLGALTADGRLYKFGIYHYANLMALAARAGQGLGQSMYAAFERADMIGQLGKDLSYPHYAVVWRAAQCQAVFGKPKDAEVNYGKALKSALSERSGFTIYAEGLGIEADMLATLNPKEMNAELDQLQKNYEILEECGIPESAKRIFAPWPGILAKLKEAENEEQIRMLRELSRSVPML